VHASVAQATFGNTLVCFERGILEIRMVSDRSEWSLEVSGNVHGDDWFDADIWRACLEGHDAQVELTAVVAQVDYVRSHLEEIQEAFGSRPDALLGCLREKRAARARASLKLARERPA
jgi:hypothetical protein